MSKLRKQDIFPHISFHSRRTILTDAISPSEPHHHDFYEVFIVEEGPLVHHINGRQEILYPDTMVLIHPQDYHFFSQKDGVTAQFFNLAFDAEQFEHAKGMAAQCAPSTVNAPMADKVTLTHELSRLLLRRMRWLRDATNPIPQEVQLTEGITLLTDILVLCTVGSGNVHTIPYWLRKACSEMQVQANMVQGISRMVEICGKTQEHLTRSMRKYMGQTPSAYINTVRLERAADQLITTARPVFEIMLDVGFQNTSYFNKLFKEKYHVSPRKYRSQTTSILGKTEK